MLVKLGLIVLLGASFGIIKNIDTVKWIFFDASNYSKTNGIITNSNIYHTGLRGGWSFSIYYEYGVDDIKFTSSRVHFGYQTSSDKSYAQGYLVKYPVGNEVLVYYDPDHPDNAILEPNVKWYGFLYYILAFIVLSLTLFSVSIYYRKIEISSKPIIPE